MRTDDSLNSGADNGKIILPICYCLILFVADSLMGGAGLGAMIAVILLFGNLLLMLINIKNRRIRNYRIISSLLLIVTIGMATGVVLINKHVGHKNATILISSIEKYRTEIGRYPKNLSMLVPDFISSIPRCAYRPSGYNDFKYFENNGHHILLWVETPPFGRPLYDFESREWRYLD